MIDPKLHFSRFLRRLAHDTDATQRDLAQRFGAHPAVMNMWWKATRFPKSDDLRNVAAKTGYSYAFIFSHDSPYPDNRTEERLYDGYYKELTG